MITSIKKIKEGKYVLNDSVIVSEFDFKNDHVQYKIDYDENEVNEQHAQDLADEFIMKALVSASENL